MREDASVLLEIRTFDEADRDGLRALFGRAGEGAPTESLWGHEPSEAAVYLEPYMDLEPASLFVAVADGELVGYLAGCLDSSTFPSESQRMGEAIKKYRLAVRAKPAAFFARSMVDVARATIRREPTSGEFDDPRWPAHLHINVEPRARGTDAAAGLMTHWLDRLNATESPGCHLQTLSENTRAVRFFERMGFTAYGPTPIVPGIRHHRGRLHQQTMVWSPSVPT